MEMHCFDQHPALRHHPCCHRTVDTAGKQGQTLAVCPQRQTAEAGDLPFVNIRSVMAHIHMQQHIRLMHVHLEHLAADKHLGADDASDFRRFDRKILVRALGLDLERMNAALRDQSVHVRDSLRTDGLQFRRRLDRFADGSNTEHLGDLLDDRLNIQCLVRPDKDQSFTSSDIDAAERFQIIADAVYQHSLKIWFIHTL